MKFTPNSWLYRYAKFLTNGDDKPFEDACSLLMAAGRTTIFLVLILTYYFALEAGVILLGAAILNKIGISEHETLFGSLVMARTAGTILIVFLAWIVYRIDKKLETIPCELSSNSLLVSFASLTNTAAKSSKYNWSEFTMNLFISLFMVLVSILLTFMISLTLVGMAMDYLDYSDLDNLTRNQALLYGLSGQILAALIYGIGYLICKNSTVVDNEAV